MKTKRVTKKEFQTYERVRQDSRYSMMTQGSRAARAAGLRRDRYWLVLTTYSDCLKKWPEVRS